jgi:hypothetical protein
VSVVREQEKKNPSKRKGLPAYTSTHDGVWDEVRLAREIRNHHILLYACMISVTELSWRRLAETVRQQKFLLVSQRRLRTL